MAQVLIITVTDPVYQNVLVHRVKQPHFTDTNALSKNT